MILKWYIDDQLVDDPNGWESLQTAIQRDREQRSILTKQEGTFQFQGEAFSLLWNKYRNLAFEGVCTVKIMQSEDGQNFDPLFIGTILLSDVEFDLKMKICKAKLYDDSYQAKISNNKNIGAFIYADRSKLDVPITALTPVQVRFFNPTAALGTYMTVGGGAYQNMCYRIKDVFEFLVSFMSDGTLQFYSDFFNDGNQDGGYNYFITTGRVLMLTDTTDENYYNLSEADFKKYWEKISFNTLWDEMRKRFNLCFQIENGNTLRVEKAEYFRKNVPAFDKILNTDELTVKTFTEQLYSKVSFGSSGDIEDGAAWSFPELIDFQGFKQEEFQTRLKTNIDKELNLRCEWITSSNVIEKMIVNTLRNDRDYDRKIFIIEAEESAGVWYARKQNPFIVGPPYYYNITLTNRNIALRYRYEIPIDIVTFLNNQASGNFRASVSPSAGGQPNIYIAPGDSSSRQILTVNLPANNESTTPNEDPSSAYDNVGFIWTCPATGVYTFETFLEIIYSGSNWRSDGSYFTAGIGTSLVLQRSDDGFSTTISDDEVRYSYFDFNIGQQYYNYLQYSTPTARQTIQLNKTILCNTNDEVRVLVKTDVTAYWNGYPNANSHTFVYNYTIQSSSYIRALTNSNDGGIYSEFNAKEYPAISIETKYPMTRDQFEAIVSDSARYIDISRHNEEIFRGRIESIKYNHIRKEANIILSGNRIENF